MAIPAPPVVFRSTVPTSKFAAINSPESTGKVVKSVPSPDNVRQAPAVAASVSSVE